MPNHWGHHPSCEPAVPPPREEQQSKGREHDEPSEDPEQGRKHHHGCEDGDRRTDDQSKSLFGIVGTGGTREAHEETPSTSRSNEDECRQADKPEAERHDDAPRDPEHGFIRRFIATHGPCTADARHLASCSPSPAEQDGQVEAIGSEQEDAFPAGDASGGENHREEEEGEAEHPQVVAGDNPPRDLAPGESARSARACRGC